jgi:hypothetical protein
MVPRMSTDFWHGFGQSLAVFFFAAPFGSALLACPGMPEGNVVAGTGAASPDRLIRPKKAGDALIYGFKGGIVVAVHPYALDGREDGGPRGLLRVGYEEGGKFYLINYVAVEPIVTGKRGFSELEKGGDGKPGKRFWVGDALADGGVGKAGNPFGRVEQSPDGRVLTFVLHVEPLENGARPVVEVGLFERSPDRVRLRTFSAAGGRPMDECVLTATMGNQSRCRVLWLHTGPVFAPKLYPGPRTKDFVWKEPYPLADLHCTEAGDLVVAISPDEPEPREVWPLPSGAWRHEGRWMAQFWLKPRGTFDAGLRCHVNGRWVYWGGAASIPGGVAFENFELREPFRPGRETWFGYCTVSPAQAFGFGYDAPPKKPVRRAVKDPEQQEAAEATRTGRRLTNGDFTQGLAGWKAEGGAKAFRTFPRAAGGMALTTYGAGKEDDTGRLYQCFVVPQTAAALRFFLHGGCDPDRLHVALWQGDRLRRRMTARDDNDPFEVRWDVAPLRGDTVTLEVVDDRAGPWGFIGAHGFALLDEKGQPLP